MSSSFYKHPNAIVDTTQIGNGTKIWAFSHIMEGARIGKNCNFGEGGYMEDGSVIGNNVVVKNNISIWDGIIIEDDVFLGPNSVFTNDLLPRAKKYHANPVQTFIKKGASIGANATIICGITIGEYAMIGAGSVVTKDVQPYSLVRGNPARFIGWICECTEKLDFEVEVTCVCGKKYRMNNDKSIIKI